jgi:uncharacterized membrane protein
MERKNMTLLNPAKSINRSPLRRALLSVRLGFIFAALCLGRSPCVLAQEQSHSPIQIIAIYDYPGAAGFINSSGINDKGDVAGYYLDTAGDFRGFVRFRNGNFSAPIIAPNDTGVTYATDINNAPTVSGESYDSVRNAYHGYLLTNQTFTLFDIEGARSTTVAGINVNGDFVGSFGPDADTGEAYIDIEGEIASFSIPGASITIGTAINGLGMVVGNYVLAADSSLHGFFRNAAGDLSYPVDFPGSTLTGLRGINDHRLVVGGYSDADSVMHGFVLKPPATFLSFTYPGATYTTLGGINNRGLVCGDYVDLNGIRHGFIARIR